MISVAVAALRYLGLLFLPLATVAYVATGPHAPLVALLAILGPTLLVIVDRHAGPARQRGATPGPAWLFDGLLAVLVINQLAVLGLFVRNASRSGPSFDLFATALLVGENAGWCSLVVAHELIHRRSRFARFWGRTLLTTVLYEHFAIEHVRGHHRRVATPDDPATARRGESLRAFQRRTVPAQWRSAWRLECARVGDESMRLLDRRQVRNRVLHGVGRQLGLLVLVTAFGGPWALLAVLYATVVAIDLLETVNYFEHWGLERRGRAASLADSWDAETWVSQYTLAGLARHADHHAHAARPYHSLRATDESPKLPYGYYGMVALAQLQNGKFRRLMSAQLDARAGRQATTP